MEDLQLICDLLTKTLKATGNLSDLKKLDYNRKTETVKATFENGSTKMADVAADSGTSMIRDIIAQIL